MSGRGPHSFKKRQKEQQRKEKQQAKLAKRLERKHQPLSSLVDEEPAPDGAEWSVPVPEASASDRHGE